MNTAPEIHVRGEGFSAFFATFWLALALLILFFYGEPDLHDLLRFRLLDGHHEKQEVLWIQITEGTQE